MTTVDLASLRLKFRSEKDKFLEANIAVKQPFHLFKSWLNEACETPEILEPNAFCLSTASKDGLPSARFVLLKTVEDDGFTFFTNYGSRKAQEIASNPNVAMTFYWVPLHRQVRIEGVASKVSRETSEKYFHERPRASQIGAAASPQSQTIPSREYLDEIESGIKEKLGPDDVVPLPNWGGYLIKPHLFEFWQGQTNRLHDRIIFRQPKPDDNKELVHEEMLPILLLINVVLCEAEWVKISQIPTSDFHVYATESSIDSTKNVDNDVPIRYEDLEHIVGPGFEDELEKFYQRHKEEVDRKRKEEKPKDVKSSETSHLPYDDPWSVYDNPAHIGAIKEPTDLKDSEMSESVVENDKNRYEEYDDAVHLNDSFHQNYGNETMEPSNIPQIVQFKLVKVKPKETEPFSFAGFMKFLRDIQSTFVSKTARSIQDKIQTLEQFRDDILLNIEERIRSLWPATPVVRNKRGITDDHHSGGMDFPSSEGALMTISFLTFAVFLIKLVLQVINTIKSKHYSYNSFDAMNNAASMNAVNIVKRNRNARSMSLTPDDLNGMTSILSAIENVGKM
ncbi:Pyridoxine/pyridoxamine 5'-phosphate oxidase [Pseudolycoriella hygida]|uniref:pyridoxal 5'-phosphate synthase n=1 Tax=Pseudolycoriella hygida TaxID=35572 RepID=A0A9Q0MXV4_9DIPT|nr:Pyridoxine/pyridoxamine 5'-phosphate oxidase [Pseudolycoriella hygida]